MAKLPYTPYPTEQPIPGTGGREISIATPAAAFGSTVAQAVQSVGGSIEHAADEMSKRALALQELRNETEAKEADARYMIGVGELHAKYSALQGQDAVKAYPQYTKDIQELRQKTREGLSNDMARRMFDGVSLSTMGRTIFNGAGHAASEQRKWSIGTAKAQMDLDSKTIEDNPKDDLLFAQKLRKIQRNANEISDLQGFEPNGPQAKAMTLEATSKAWAQRIIGLSRTDPFAAAAALDANRKNLTQADFLQVDNSVRSQARAVGSVNIANSVYDAEPGASLEAMEAKARAEAAKQSPDDPLLAQHAVTALRGRYNQDKYAKKQQVYENEDIINGAIVRGVKNEQELRLDPQVAKAIDALPDKDKLEIPGRINRYNASRDKVANEQEYWNLRGLASNDVEAFLNTDVTSRPINQAQMRELVTLQEKLKKNPNMDPRVDRAKMWMRNAFGAQLEALGVYNRTSSNKEQFDHYTGALQAALDTWQEAHGRPPTYKEFQEQIGPQVIKQRSERGWGAWLFGPTQRGAFDQDVPAEWADKVREDLKARGATEPTEEELYQAYIRKQFIELYGTKGSAVKPSGKDQSKAK